ncbi:hypothetical protein ACP4OV_022919 [Aristida adscensionis]
MPITPSEAIALQATGDGNLRLVSKMAREVDLKAAKDCIGRNALHYAAPQGHLAICKFLVEEVGIDVNSRSLEGQTPMQLTAAEGDRNVPVLRYLLDCGGDPAAPGCNGTTPLHRAAEFGHCEAVRLLLSKGVPVDPVDHRGTPLLLAATRDQDQAIKILLEHGANGSIKEILEQENKIFLYYIPAHLIKLYRDVIWARSNSTPGIPEGPKSSL